jgi:hypothetical protein
MERFFIKAEALLLNINYKGCCPLATNSLYPIKNLRGYIICSGISNNLNSW